MNEHRLLTKAPESERATRRAGRCRRRGAAYVFFLGAAMLVVVIGLSAITWMRIQLRQDRWRDEAARARQYAQSAIEIGLAKIMLDPGWRNTFSGGTWLANTAIGDGYMSLASVTLSDADAYLNNNSIVFTATGQCGDAVHKIDVTLEALSDNGGMAVQAGSWKRHVD